MKNLIGFGIAILVFIALSFIIYFLGTTYDIQNYTYAPITLSCFYSFFLTVVSVGGFYFTKEVTKS